VTAVVIRDADGKVCEVIQNPTPAQLKECGVFHAAKERKTA
jgi:hypothetical protein